VELQQGTGCGEDVNLAGPLPDGGLWLSCVRAATTIRRLHPDGSLAGETTVVSAPIDGSTSVVSPDGAFLYLWNPLSSELTRIELATGEATKTKAPAAAITTADPLGAFGRWLAPSVAAKNFLEPGIAISPDGTRIYALGVQGLDHGDLGGSAGLVVFDVGSILAPGRCPSTGEFTL